MTTMLTLKPQALPGVKELRILLLIVVTFFIGTFIVLHSTVEGIDDEANLLRQSADWQHGAAASSTTTKSFRKQGNQGVRSKPLLAAVSAPHVTDPNSQRALFEQSHPPADLERTRRVVESLRKPHPLTASNNITYDIFACPSTPPSGYPFEWSIVNEILRDWPVDETEMPARIHQGLCVFDFNADLEKIETYRRMEVPFVMQNHPEVMQAAERWSSPNYLGLLIGDTPQRNEHSKTNHFMFWRVPKHHNDKNFHPPTENVDLSYTEWRDRALAMEGKPNQQDQEHWYFRLNAAPHNNVYLYEELPFFKASDIEESTLFMVEPDKARGINCRFGMKGVVAECHFDVSRNWIILLGGQRRYILSHPNQCVNMEMYPKNHPSGRHSMVDWSHPPPDPSRPFRKATANEVVMQAGDALYLPTNWLHFIVSLNVNYQCNARSGTTEEYHNAIRTCGFPI